MTAVSIILLSILIVMLSYMRGVGEAAGVAASIASNGTVSRMAAAAVVARKTSTAGRASDHVRELIGEVHATVHNRGVFPGDESVRRRARCRVIEVDRFERVGEIRRQFEVGGRGRFRRR
jgi:hypothetical protein